MTAPARLLAPPPGWTLRADVVVVGSGVAGLSCALRVADTGADVLLVTKTGVDEGSTRWAQGGVAAALDPADSPEEHLRDTLVAGVGLCDEAAVRVLCTEGPLRLRELAALGAAFDRDASGEWSLTREGGHSRSRIVHAGGDATGAEVQRALVAAVRAHPRVRLVESALVLDLLQDAGGAAAGVTLHVIGEGTADGVGAVHARAVVLATGGLGQVFASTTNPSVSTGDGTALALRAGASVADLEFVQFHPTALYLGGAGGGQQSLVSEAVRGEGAVLVDASGRRVITTDDHPLADLAPRDVVAKAIFRRMRATDAAHVLLDATGLGEQVLLARFPTIVARCRAAGFDPVQVPVPVAPAAHYASGGVLTDLDGRTSVHGLYAVGEVACTGVHGANRLASNSLLEGLVFAARIAASLAVLPTPGPPVERPAEQVLVDPAVRVPLGEAMSAGAGVLRSAASLSGAADAVATLRARTSDAPCPDAWEATSLVQVAGALVAAALRRAETRGAHWREDFPDADDGWRGRLVTTLGGTAFAPLAGVPA